MRLDEPSSALIGRDVELARLRERVMRVEEGRPQIVVVEGEAGVGKSALLSELTSIARSRAYQLVVATCEELDARPFGPLSDALRVAVGSEDPELATLSSLLAGRPASGEAGATDDVPAAQYQIIEGIGGLVERLGGRSTVLLAVDDLHWADPSSLAALRSVARRVEGLPVCIVVTLRSGHGAPHVDRAVDWLVRTGALHLTVEPLGDEAVAELVGRLVRAQPGPTLLELVAGAAGNPLFVKELVGSLEAEGCIAEVGQRADVAERRVPVGFRQSVVRRVRQLPMPTFDVLRTAAVLGTTFLPAELAIATRRPAMELAGPLQQAVAAGLVVERTQALGFRHALVRDAIYEDIPLLVRRELHREAGRALAAAGKTTSAAVHVGMAAVPGEREAVDTLLDAATGLATRDPAQAVTLLERALSLVAQTDPPRHDVAAELVMALGWSGRVREAERVARDLLDANPPADIAGKVRIGLAHVLLWRGLPGDALAQTEVQSTSARPDSALLLSQRALAGSMANLGSARARSLVAPAIEAAERIGDQLALCQALCAQAWSRTFSGHAPESIDAGRRAVAIAEQSGNAEPHRAAPHLFLGHALNLNERFDEARQVLRTGRRISEELGLAWQLPLYDGWLANRAFLLGDWDEALAEDEASLAMAEELGLDVGLSMAMTPRRATILLHRGQLEEAERLIADGERRLAQPGAHRIGLVALARADFLAATGDLRAAVAALEEQWPHNVELEILTELRWIGALLAVLWRRLGDARRAAFTIAPLEMLATRSGSGVAEGAALLCRGLAEDDVGALVASLDPYRRGGRTRDLALACAEVADVMAERGQLPEAERLFDEAAGLYEHLQASLDLDRMYATMRARGLRRGVRRPHVRATTGWESLTATERRVVDLVAAGMTNPEIGGRLFLSRHTVASHLKHVYAKLDLSSRAELAAQVARRAHDRL